MARRRSKLRNLVEFALARSVMAMARILPASSMQPVAKGLGGILYLVIKSRRKVVRENVKLAFGDARGTPEADALGRASLSNLCRSFMELSRIPRDREAARGLVRFRDAETWERTKQAADGGPFVVAASHFGAYEMPGVLSELIGFPASTIVRPLDNPLLERFMAGIRVRFGQRIVSNRGGFRALIRALGEGRNVAVMVDLNHRRARRIYVDYFGTPAATAPTAALLAILSGRPLVCSFPRRMETPLQFELEMGELHWPRPGAKRQEEIQRLMQLVTDDIEKRVRAEPELWLWTHRRWKTRPAVQERAES